MSTGRVRESNKQTPSSFRQLSCNLYLTTKSFLLWLSGFHLNFILLFHQFILFLVSSIYFVGENSHNFQFAYLSFLFFSFSLSFPFFFFYHDFLTQIWLLPYALHFQAQLKSVSTGFLNGIWNLKCWSIWFW